MRKTGRKWKTMKRIIRGKPVKLVVITVMLLSVLPITSSCVASGEGDLLESLLENVGATGGELTMYTKDGEKVTVTVTRETPPDSVSENDEKTEEPECESPDDGDCDETDDLTSVLPSINSEEDVFMTLGVWDEAKALRNDGCRWARTAEELGYTKETMYTALQADMAGCLGNAKELDLITAEQYDYKYRYFCEQAMKWVQKIFADADSAESLSTILPKLDSREDIFRTLGAWEEASALREQGFEWSRTAEELGYTSETMYDALKADTDARLRHARELGFIDDEQFEYKQGYYNKKALSWTTKIFTDTDVDEDLTSILPKLDSIEDIFRTLATWEGAAALREQGCSWLYTARQLGYTEEAMYAALQADTYARLQHARELGLIDDGQFEYKQGYYGEKASKWTTKIFLDDESGDDLTSILPNLDSKEGVFRTLGIWEDAETLLGQGLSWSHTAEELGYTEETLYTALQTNIQERLHHAKVIGLITYEEYEYKLELYDEKALKQSAKIFAY